MIYLLGACHSIQSAQDEVGEHLRAKLERFKAFVSNTATAKQVECIAEESNIEREQIAGKTIARFIAEQSQPPLLYVACEPTNQERVALGVPTNNVLAGSVVQRDAELLRYLPPREKFWLERLRSIQSRSILLVLGANHVRTFACRLLENGIPCEVISFDWCESDDHQHGRVPLDEQRI